MENRQSESKTSQKFLKYVFALCSKFMGKKFKLKILMCVKVNTVILIIFFELFRDSY